MSRPAHSGTGHPGATRLHLRPINCHAHGICAELLPEMITLDEWGYPILADAPVPEDLLPFARRAVAACPTLALKLIKSASPSMRAG